MLNEELYEQLEREFTRCRIGEEVEDILLELAEALGDMGVRGICEEGEEGEAPSVYIRTLTVNGKEFEIEDYLL